MDTHRQIALSENLKKFQSYVFFLNSSPELEFHLVRNQLPGWFQPGFPPCWTCLNIWVASYSLISISISLYLVLSPIPWPDQLVFGVPPPLKFPSNSIKASTLVTIKPWSKPPEREQVDIVFEKKLGARVLQITRREPGSGEGSREQNILTSCPSRPPPVPIITNPVHN